MLLKVLIFLLLLFVSKGFSQYHFEGQLPEKTPGKTVYLSLIEDYRKLSRVSFEQIIKKTMTDSLGVFRFEGTNLSLANRIYRIHVDECSEDDLDANHFFGSCANSKSILFIANTNDTVFLPLSLTSEALCEVTSTNDKSSVFLKINALKNEMAFDFNSVRSAASRKLNTQKWFSNLQLFGATLNEPLAELYIFDFLSDKRNETYGYYLKDITVNPYYLQLAERLESEYPNTSFTSLYQAEINTDLQFAAQKIPTISYWKWLLGILLVFSLVLNILLLVRQKALKKKHRNRTRDILTTQEQKIVAEILKDKTNKEIASDLFISLSTVKTHINNLYKKLNINSREEIKGLFG